MRKKFLEILDKKLFEFLLNNNTLMPKRICKMIAYFYSDARVRKIYWERLNVFMGENTYSNIGMMAVNSENTKVCIGNNVSIAPYVTFITESEPNNGKKILELEYIKKLKVKGNIIIEDDVWIGANVTILPGIHIGRCAVIGAGSVVTKDVESYSIYVGVPAKKIKDIRDEKNYE